MLLANGHPDAHNYPVGMVFVEAEYVALNLNSLEATRAVLTQLAVSSLLSKKSGKEFNKTLKKLTGGG